MSSKLLDIAHRSLYWQSILIFLVNIYSILLESHLELQLSRIFLHGAALDLNDSRSFHWLVLGLKWWQDPFGLELLRWWLELNRAIDLHYRELLSLVPIMDQRVDADLLAPFKELCVLLPLVTCLDIELMLHDLVGETPILGGFQTEREAVYRHDVELVLGLDLGHRAQLRYD